MELIGGYIDIYCHQKIDDGLFLRFRIGMIANVDPKIVIYSITLLTT